jgi:predicted RNA-binding Zn-ribbon protein involved in translation (DUF1610 family)
MSNSRLAKKASVKTSKCPYCGETTTFDLPGDYEPVYAVCSSCGKKFIAQRHATGFQLFTREEAPCLTDPDCREIELGGYDEE